MELAAIVDERIDYPVRVPVHGHALAKWFNGDTGGRTLVRFHEVRAALIYTHNRP